MKTVNNHAFWREILDQLPMVILVFRIDEDDHVQLIFANNEVENILGFKPRDYVMASESPGRVKQETDQLIDYIAELSHKKTKPDNLIFSLSSQAGTTIDFKFDFKLFQTRSNQSNLIVTSFYTIRDDTLSGSGKSKQNGTSVFVADSDIMKALMGKVSEFARSRSNVLIRGEKSTGKRTIARILSGMIETGKEEVHRLDLSGLSSEKQDILLFGNGSESGAGILTKDRDVILIVNDIASVSEPVQKKFISVLQSRMDNHLQTRIIATSRVAIEDLIEEDKFEAGLYYALDFQPLLVPPLRHRKEEIPKIARKWIKQVAFISGIEVNEIPVRELERLIEPEWKGNFSELYDVLRISLLNIRNGEFKVMFEKKKELSQQQMILSETQQEVVSFDEMNRQYLSWVLRITKGKIYGEGGAAELLDLKPTTLQSKLKKLNIK